METYILYAIIGILCFICLILIILAKIIDNKAIIGKKLLEFADKFDDYTNIKKISYVFTNEVKTLLKADLVAVIEYSYAKTDILSAIPLNNPDKSLLYPHELYLILKSLEQENITHCQNDDIQSEHFKKLFPLYNYEHYHILQLFSDESKIITLEIYGNLNNSFNQKKNILKKLISVFQKVFIQQNKFRKELIITRKNEIIIKFLDRIRNTLEENELEKVILEELCHAFNADRTYFITSNKNNLQNPILGREYLGNPYTKSLKGNNLDFQSVWQQMSENKINPPVFVIEDVHKFIKQKDIQGTAIDTFLQKSQIKSSYPFLVYEDDENLLYLVLQYTKNVVIFDKSDFETMELLTKQTHIALSQAKLYTKLIQKNKKEKFLKEIYADTINLQTKKQIYAYFAGKITQLLNSAGIVFVDFPRTPNDKIEYFEHYKTQNINISKFKNFNFINELINSKNLTYTCNLNKENLDGIEFFNQTGTVCIATLPISNNALMVIFFTNKKEISQIDKNILFSLVDVISKTIKDTLKTAEINGLRERFLSTLTHDLQIPLIAERNAINYLMSKKGNWDNSMQELLGELQETNNQIEDMLKALTAIYKYETGKKELIKENCNILNIADTSISKLSKLTDKKQITIKKEINTENLNFFGDKIEITKVLIIFLLNAINDTDKNGEILFEISDNGKYLKCCITSEGKMYSDNLRKIIFDGNITSNALEYRVGEEIYLYLVKLIINAHSGRVYVNNKESKGNIFCIELEKII